MVSGTDTLQMAPHHVLHQWTVPRANQTQKRQHDERQPVAVGIEAFSVGAWQQHSRTRVHFHRTNTVDKHVEPLARGVELLTGWSGDAVCPTHGFFCA